MERKLAKVEKQSSSAKKDPVEETMKLDTISNDAWVLFSHFPKEIWLLITGKVTDSETLINLMQASPEFRSLLLPRRVEFLFPQVWKVLGVKFEESKDDEYTYDIDKMHPDRLRLSRFREMTPWISRILTLRLVCKSWCCGVDDFYQNVSYSRECRMFMDRETVEYEDYPGEIRLYGRRYEWTKNAFSLESTKKIAHFHEHFDKTHFNGGNLRSPIITRNIELSHGRDGREKGNFSWLSKYGQHFWFCELFLEDDFPTMVSCYTELKEFLTLLPNVKKLTVIYILRNGTCNNRVVSKKDIQEIASNPLPKLHKMEFLYVDELPAYFTNALISANNHISMLRVRYNDDTQCGDIYTLPMPNLKQLSLQYDNITDIEGLYKPEVSWSLEKIYLDYRNSFSTVPWSQIFSLLENKWATTLTTVEIYFSNSHPHPKNAIGDGSSLQLNLPKVQRFILRPGELFSLDLIMQMKSLEFFEVAFAIPRNERQLHSPKINHYAQRSDYFRRLDESNIWDLLPKLKSFQFVDFDGNQEQITPYKRRGR